MRIERQDPYAVLGVTPTASPAQISRAYRTLLHTHHPDTRNHNTPNPRPDPDVDVGADADAGRNHDVALRQVLAAYAVLHDPQRRADYDRRRRAAAPPAQPGHPAAATPPIVILGDATDAARSRWARPIWIAPFNPPPVATAPITTLFAVLPGHTDAQFYRGR